MLRFLFNKPAKDNAIDLFSPKSIINNDDKKETSSSEDETEKKLQTIKIDIGQNLQSLTHTLQQINNAFKGCENKSIEFARNLKGLSNHFDTLNKTTALFRNSLEKLRSIIDDPKVNLTKNLKAVTESGDEPSLITEIIEKILNFKTDVAASQALVLTVSEKHRLAQIGLSPDFLISHYDPIQRNIDIGSRQTEETFVENDFYQNLTKSTKTLTRSFEAFSQFLDNYSYNPGFNGRPEKQFASHINKIGLEYKNFTEVLDQYEKFIAVPRSETLMNASARQLKIFQDSCQAHEEKINQSLMKKGLLYTPNYNKVSDYLANISILLNTNKPDSSVSLIP